MTAEKALDVLEAFLKHRDELGISELSQISQINVSTAHRIAAILVKRGYLFQASKRAKYSLGPRLLEFGPVVMSGMTVRDIARPFLEEILKEVNESVNMAILDSNRALIIDYVQPSLGLIYINKIGQRLPLHNSGLGKVLLAHMEEREFEKFLQTNGLPAYTKNTITDPVCLMKELKTIKDAGIAFDNEENELGGKCLAAPIKDGRGKVVASFSVSVPSTRLDNDRIETLKLLLKDKSDRISEVMGYRPNEESF
jgi:DNA-binding IclR family transcriptional regulator